MAFVVTEPCVKCKLTDCVSVCPVDAFHEGENMLVIDPGECIDCQACVPACPTQAIYLEEDVPAKWSAYIALNARLAPRFPVIAKQKAPLPDWEAWKDAPGKLAMVSETPGGGS
jgi:ferredoxin